MKNKNILFLIDKIESGGAENVLIKIINYFSECNYNVYILPNLTVDDKYLYKLENINYVNPNITIRNNILSKIYSFCLYFFKILFFVKKHKPIRVISFLERSNIANILVSKLTKHTSVISTRNNLTLQYKNRNYIEKNLIHYFINKTYNKSSLLITLSESVKDDLVSNFNINKNIITTIYNPYNIKKIMELADEQIEGQDNCLFNDYTCITMGRLTEQKGHLHLIHSFALVVNKIEEAKLIILGEGELEDIINKEILNLGLEKNIILLNHQKNPYKYLKKSKIFLFPSLWEGFGNALLEAMICGKAVISTDCDSGPREILSKAKNSILNQVELAEYGILVPVFTNDNVVESEKIFSEAILLLMNDKNLCNKYEHQAKLRAIDFDDKNILNLWHEAIMVNL